MCVFNATQLRVGAMLTHNHASDDRRFKGE